MHILLTGATGVVGSTINKYFTASNCKIIKLDRHAFMQNNMSLSFLSVQTIDLIIHCAANTNVEDCEKNPNDCYLDNSFLTERLAYFSGKYKIKMVYISSTGIYGDYKKDPYHEFDQVLPTTHHHKSKFLGEQYVLQLAFEPLILRTGWIFGGSSSIKNGFVQKVISQAQSFDGDYIFSNKDQFGCPTYVEDFVQHLDLLVNAYQIGIFNLVNSGNASRFLYVKKILELSNITCSVKPVGSDYFNRSALVSNNEMAFSLKLTQLGFDNLPHWIDSLKHYMSILNNE